MSVKFLRFLHVIATVLYMGGIITHIIIPVTAGDDPVAMYYGRVFMTKIAWIMINPGFIIALLSGTVFWFKYKTRPRWMKVKVVFAVYLGINAFFILNPMLEPLTELARQGMEQGVITEEFKALAHKEEIFGATNTMPLLLSVIFGIFKPSLKRKKKEA